jgi:hypothetical protein
MHISAALCSVLPLLASGVAAAPSFQLPFTKSKIANTPGRGEVIDLQKYTIGQILNYTLSKHNQEHHDGDHEHHDIARALEDHGHSHHPPLVKLAWIVNRTESVRYFLRLLTCTHTLALLIPPHTV